MEILFSILTGFTNGFFASGAGQILLFYMIFIQKEDGKKARNITLFIMPVVSIISLFYYIKNTEIEIFKMCVLVIISIIFGTIGNKAIKRVDKNILNIISGVILVIVTSINIWRSIWYIL